MGWIKKIKHGGLVFFVAALVSCYFIFERIMINDIESSMKDSLNYYQTIANRDELLGELISEYRESFSRNITFPVPSNLGDDYSFPTSSSAP